MNDNNIMAVFEVWNEMYRALEKLPTDDTGNGLRMVLCMTVDYVAAKIGTSSVEILEELTPIISAVNAEMGVMPL